MVIFLFGSKCKHTNLLPFLFETCVQNTNLIDNRNSWPTTDVSENTRIFRTETKAQYIYIGIFIEVFRFSALEYADSQKQVQKQSKRKISEVSEIFVERKDQKFCNTHIVSILSIIENFCWYYR